MVMSREWDQPEADSGFDEVSFDLIESHYESTLCPPLLLLAYAESRRPMCAKRTEGKDKAV